GLSLKGVESVSALSSLRVKFMLGTDHNRDLIINIASMPIISKDFFATRKFDVTTVTPIVGSGPYKVSKVEIGRRIVYDRDPDYWGKDLSVNRGRYNFDQIRVDYFRDRSIAFEAFTAGEYDFHEEFNSKRWFTQYDRPAVRRGHIKREKLVDNNPSGVQAFFFNLRRSKFKDRRVRQALNLAFDFEWTNQRLFYNLYKRTNSMFENSSLAAHMLPGPRELALLEPLRDLVPVEVFKQPFRSATTDGSGVNRSNLLTAVKLLREAGWKVKKGRLVDRDGKPFDVEFLISKASFQRIIGPYLKNLRRLGIRGFIRRVDAANFQRRRQRFQFDIIMQRYVQRLTPGVEQKNYYGSAAANEPGSLNYPGIENVAVDTLIDHILSASSRPALIASARALDRVLMWNYYLIPQWYKGVHNIAYWDKFSRPRQRPKFDIGLIDTWWYDIEKARQIDSSLSHNVSVKE
ncbi:extracellular solute-binding protein, partial [Pseudomonadota bacterium]